MNMFHFEFWWIFPILMIILCFLMMRGRMGRMCGHGSHGEEDRGVHADDSAADILDRRYARGEMDKREYEEKKRVLSRQE
jgi:putative membrane protein